jgi:NAD(P)-dependent dehydrogenase (short-subunit alcohol dehydrogenase family)
MAYPESLQNKVVLIVGGAGAIGGAAARMFASPIAHIHVRDPGPPISRPAGCPGIV